MTKFKLSILVLILLIASVFLISYGEAGFIFNETIVWQLRFPKLMVALCSGGILATAGLLMQVFFQNPLAGPDILGVSAGSSLFVAFWIMGAGLFPSFLYDFGASFLSLLGALSVFGILLFFLHKRFSRFSLLIVGLLISTFASSCISFLINLSNSLQIKNYLIWTLGSFRNVTIDQLPYFLLMSLLSICPLFFLPKALNQFQLGEDYAQTMGLNVYKIKKVLITTCAFSISTVTLFCGPIGFIGIIAPHLARFYMKSCDMKYILPATFLCGSVIALLAETLQVLLPTWSLSVNTILGFFGAPLVILYLYRQRSWNQ
jgi:iron complex transport system permease protein